MTSTPSSLTRIPVTTTTTITDTTTSSVHEKNNNNELLLNQTLHIEQLQNQIDELQNLTSKLLSVNNGADNASTSRRTTATVVEIPETSRLEVVVSATSKQQNHDTAKTNEEDKSALKLKENIATSIMLAGSSKKLIVIELIRYNDLVFSVAATYNGIYINIDGVPFSTTLNRNIRYDMIDPAVLSKQLFQQLATVNKHVKSLITPNRLIQFMVNNMETTPIIATTNATDLFNEGTPILEEKRSGVRRKFLDHIVARETGLGSKCTEPECKISASLVERTDHGPLLYCIPHGRSKLATYGEDYLDKIKLYMPYVIAINPCQKNVTISCLDFQAQTVRNIAVAPFSSRTRNYLKREWTPVFRIPLRRTSRYSERNNRFGAVSYARKSLTECRHNEIGPHQTKTTISIMDTLCLLSSLSFERKYLRIVQHKEPPAEEDTPFGWEEDNKPSNY